MGEDKSQNFAKIHYSHHEKESLKIFEGNFRADVDILMKAKGQQTMTTTKHCFAGAPMFHSIYL